MAQIFHRSTNVLSRVSLFGAVFALAGAAWGLGALDRSPYVTGQGLVRPQPVPFSHEHHVSGLGLDCRYCHVAVESSPFAGMPSTATCMGCHAHVWTDAPVLEPLRASFAEDEPLAWTRVYDLPDFAYFDHGIHVAKGIGCESCHGRVDRMPLMRQEVTLQMRFCLDCHREPERFVRPRGEVFTMGWRPPPGTTQERLGAQLVEAHGIRSETSCSTCHR